MPGARMRACMRRASTTLTDRGRRTLKQLSKLVTRLSLSARSELPDPLAQNARTGGCTAIPDLRIQARDLRNFAGQIS